MQSLFTYFQKHKLKEKPLKNHTLNTKQKISEEQTLAIYKDLLIAFSPEFELVVNNPEMDYEIMKVAVNYILLHKNDYKESCDINLLRNLVVNNKFFWYYDDIDAVRLSAEISESE